jgi:hypothetical protein
MTFFPIQDKEMLMELQMDMNVFEYKEDWRNKGL